MESKIEIEKGREGEGKRGDEQRGRERRKDRERASVRKGARKGERKRERKIERGTYDDAHYTKQLQPAARSLLPAECLQSSDSNRKGKTDPLFLWLLAAVHASLMDCSLIP